MRIVAGKYRGRKLAEFAGSDIRPTPDRVKESLFQILTPRLHGARVLDLFAGSGALGLECLSRGAREAAFNDASAESCKVLKRNLSALGEQAQTTSLDFRACLSRAEGKFDLIFADPPYAKDFLEELLTLVRARGLLERDGLVLYESEAPQAGAAGWELADERRYGRTRVCFWRIAGEGTE